MGKRHQQVVRRTAPARAEATGHADFMPDFAWPSDRQYL